VLLLVPESEPRSAALLEVLSEGLQVISCALKEEVQVSEIISGRTNKQMMLRMQLRDKQGNSSPSPGKNVPR
jgi:hypothetical protein